MFILTLENQQGDVLPYYDPYSELSTQSLNKQVFILMPHIYSIFFIKAPISTATYSLGQKSVI